jgi:predicted protein tyrosine phosphatase
MERRVKGNRSKNLKVIIESLKGVIKNLEYIKKSDMNVISIRDYGEYNRRDYDTIDNAGINNLLVVQFDDLVEELPKEYNKKERPPSENDISTILNWAKQKMKENDKDFLVHCSAGISRSSAVAILVQYINDPSKAIKTINPLLHSPNELVLEIGEKLLNTKDIKDPTKEFLKKNDEEWMEI